ncbi:Translocon-associated protein subunit beta [Carex littledalei]|uniref:Translocon-associated protein subunit beta n=1 Tax=Carex littledalei TaxID=544730 RepID=A0A833RKV6_9POAL|nr:Translocon-associated protein subunit beta [Carex littledalei]
MAICRSLLFLPLLLFAIAGCAAIAHASDASIPFLLAHKKVSLERLKSGSEQVTVSIDLYNEGSTTAYDVILNDDSWSQEVFETVSGAANKTWEKLDPGASVSHSFVLKSDVKGVFQGSPAVVKFRVPTKAALQEALSSPVRPIDILAERPPEKKFEWRLAAKYGSLVSVLTLVGIFIYMVASPSKSGKGGKKRR